MHFDPSRQPGDIQTDVVQSTGGICEPERNLGQTGEKSRFIRGFGIQRHGIFGSYARNEQGATSDMDFLPSL
jgi:hypothetical protein